jgi:acetamidase/formamidase
VLIQGYLRVPNAPQHDHDVIRVQDLDEVAQELGEAKHYHHELVNLSNTDDHTQYYCVNGRSGDILTVNNTTSSTSPGNGSVIVKGGVGVAGNLNIGGNVNIGSSISVTHDLNCGANLTSQKMTCTTAPSTSTDVVRLADMPTPVTSHNGLTNLTNSDDHTQYFLTNGRSGDILRVNNTTASISTATGAIVVKGGPGVAGDVIIGGNVKIGSSITVSQAC